VKWYGQHGRKAGRIIIKYEKYGRKCWNVKGYGKYGRKTSQIVKRYGHLIMGEK
jgi:hypothetical protein